MKASELIKRLERYIEKYGDLPCVNSLYGPVHVTPMGSYDYNDVDMIVFE